MGKTTERIEYIDTLRGLAIVVVVATHLQEIVPVSSIITEGLDYELVGPLTVFFRNINIIFTFVSGFLFLMVDGERDWPSLMLRKFKNLVVPYIVVSVPAISLYLLGYKYFDFGGNYNVFEKLIYFIFTGNHLGPLWFVPMIMVLFSLSAVWRSIDQLNLYWIIVPLIVIALFVERPPQNDNPLRAAVFFAPVFLAGMLTFRIREKAELFLSSNTVLASGMIFTAISIFCLHMLSPVLTSSALNNAIYVCKFPVLLFFFGVCVRWNASAPVWISTLGLASYSVFLLHGYFVGALRTMVPHLPTSESFFVRLACYLTICIVVTTLCFYIAKTSRAVTKPFNRLIIGF